MRWSTRSSFVIARYLELMLKDTVMEARRYHGINEPLDAKHPLLRHWKPLRPLLEKRWPSDPGPLDAVEENLRQFDEVDEGSFAFRYSVTKQGSRRFQMRCSTS